MSSGAIAIGLAVQLLRVGACVLLEHRLVVLWLDWRVLVPLHHRHVVPLRRAVTHVGDKRLEVVESESFLLDGYLLPERVGSVFILKLLSFLSN